MRHLNSPPPLSSSFGASALLMQSGLKSKPFPYSSFSFSSFSSFSSLSPFLASSVAGAAKRRVGGSRRRKLKKKFKI